MTNFFRFPATPHLTCLDHSKTPREDKILSSSEANALLASEIIVVEEKIDGANIGFSLAEDGTLQVQNRGQYIRAPYVGQFYRLARWLDIHGEQIRRQLKASLVLFGEWSAARHSIGYDYLPDLLLTFDVYDRSVAKFWSSSRRDALASSMGISTVPALIRGRTNLADLIQILMGHSSRYRAGPMEGLVVRRETQKWCEARAKLVHTDFTQAIEKHWSRRRIEWNRVDWSACSGQTAGNGSDA